MPFKMGDYKIVGTQRTKVAINKYNMVASLARMGYGANVIQVMLMETIYALRRQTLQGIVRQVKDLIKKEQAFVKLSDVIKPTKGYLTESDFEAPFNYWVHFRTEAIDMDTGELIPTRHSYFTDTLRPKQDWKKEIESKLDPDKYANIAGFINVQVIGAEHNRARPY